MILFSKKIKRIDEISHKDLLHTLDLTQQFYYKGIARRGIGFVAVVLIIGALFYATNSRGQIALLYPSTCLGNWVNTSQAQGEPTLEQGNSPLVFSDENSAIASGRGGELFCGGFLGSLPDNMSLAHVELKVVWNYTQPRYTESDTLGQVVERTIEISLDQQASSTPALIEEIQDDTVSTSTPSDIQEEEVAPPQEVYLNVATSTQVFQEESLHETSTLQEPIIPIAPQGQDDLVVVKYSIDGETWFDLGMLKAGHVLASFDLPLENTKDVTALQIEFISLANPKEQVVFIEGMILEVEHSEQEVFSLRQRLPALQHRDFSLDLAAAHDCSVEPFTTIIRENETKELTVAARVIPQERYILEIANLPDYIEGMFIESEKQFIEMDGVGEATFTLKATPNAQKGSFSLTMLVKKMGEDLGAEPIAFCQFNVISE